MPPEPPQNAGYMVAAYLVTAAVLAAYVVALWRRARRALGGETARGGGPGSKIL